MEDFYKDDREGFFTVAELIEWLRTNCNGKEHCTGVGGGNVNIAFADNGKRIVFE